MRLAAFRPYRRRRSTSAGSGSSWARVRTWWVHPFADGTDLVELLAAEPAAREEAADVAAQSDGLRPTDVVLLPPVYPTAMRDFLTFEAHVDGMERGHGNPGVAGGLVRRPGRSCSWRRTR